MKVQEYIDKYYDSDMLLPDLIKRVWGDAIDATLQSIADGFVRHKDDDELSKLQFVAFEELSNKINSFPKPELK